ncbi:MAG: hypothetical protein ACLTMD_08435 [Clostridium sp.]
MEMPAFERLMEDYGDEISLVAVNCGEMLRQLRIL